MMHRLRHTPNLIRFALVWLVLWVGLAVAAPVLRPGAAQMVCTSAGGLAWLDSGDDSGAVPSLQMDCPLCLTLAAPPAQDSSGRLGLLPRVVLGMPLVEGTRVAMMAAPPLPSRGPPLWAC